MNEDRLKIAVFIDFDNIEIGVKSTLNRHFDVGTVLEAIKERGEVVTKVAYGDWKRAGDHSRSMTQHAIQMVQRNLTPGGDKNGADINLALDALEMAFTRNHINAFVIVGGDSDFMALVEKLKQYDKKVMVVGGRSFTSIILQKNCHEFIAYENLIQPQSSGGHRKPAERARAVEAGDGNLAKALPLVRRALKVLSDREVSPQLGLLKSTLLQLDSTFSERDYAASTFRDFIEKMAAAGYVKLKQVDRSILVELVDAEAPAVEEGARETEREAAVEPAVEVPPTPPTVEQTDECLRALREAFLNAKFNPHWPMYVRNVKQYVKNAAPGFDERRFGFANFLEALRAAQRGGLLRLERNRQGILRVFQGSQFPSADRRGLPVDDVMPAETETDAIGGDLVPDATVTVLEEAAAVVEAEAIIDAAPESGEIAEESVEVIADGLEEEPETQPEESTAARRRRPSSATRKKTAVPRGSGARRTRKKAAGEGEQAGANDSSVD
ncbi:MAG TPA: NYN domain-containing protein [Terriglobia bacterium]|nr:NYN domain-containing protein [Terriglobia bacterium]